jgi:transposase
MTLQPTIEEFTALQQDLQAALSQRETLASQLRFVSTERDLLKDRLDKLMRKIFAAKSEARGTEQKDMFFNEAEALAAATQATPALEDGTAGDDGALAVAAHKRLKRGRKPLHADLPRHVVRHELPESERVCPHDGSVLQEIGVEASEQLDIIPQQVRVIRHERVKYACPCCDGALRLACKPAQIIPKGLFSESALAWIVTSKYDDGLPLYRQAALLARFAGGDFSKNTMAASMIRVGIGVQPIINLMRDHLLESPITFGDETTVQVLKEAGRSPQSKSYMWAQMTNACGSSGTGPPIRLFSYAPSRSGVTAQALYAGMSRGSVLMSDGYEVYAQVALTHDLVHLGCWAHCRRYFVEALDALPKSARTPDKPAAQFLALIARLYAVESHAQDNNLSASDRLRYRQQHSVAVLEHIQTLLLAHLHTVVPGSSLGKALHYLSAQWPKLSRYVGDGSYPIDNNPCENSIRPFVVGRRNWLFSDTVAGANASANLYSLLQTCKVNGINSYRYLNALLVALPLALTADDYEALLPWNIVLPIE